MSKNYWLALTQAYRVEQHPHRPDQNYLFKNVNLTAKAKQQNKNKIKNEKKYCTQAENT